MCVGWTRGRGLGIYPIYIPVVVHLSFNMHSHQVINVDCGHQYMVSRKGKKELPRLYILDLGILFWRIIWELICLPEHRARTCCI